MVQSEAFGQPLEPEPGFISRGPDAAEIARRDAEYLAPSEPEDPEGIVGTSAPEHRWPGIAFVCTFAAVGLFGVGRILLLLRNPGDLTLGQVLAALPMMLFPGALALWIAWKIHAFRLVGLGAAMFSLAMTLFFSFVRILTGNHVAEIGLGFLLGGLAVLWIGYLWNRRSDFS